MTKLTKRQRQCAKAYQELGSIQKAADSIGINYKTVWYHLKQHEARTGQLLSPEDFHEHSPIGYLPGKTTQEIRYTDEGGEVVREWLRSEPSAQDYEMFLTWLEKRTPNLKATLKKPKEHRKDLMLEWMLMDHHLGMHSWAKETGADYSIKLAQTLINNAAAKIFELHGPVQKAVIVLGGDNQHADNRSNVTEKSGYTLDVDTRYAKMVDAMWASMVTAIDIALTKAMEVEVLILSGNHDFHSAINLSRILAAHYRDVPRVTINTSPEKHKFLRWGTTAFMYTHGDTGTPNRLAGYMLNWLIDAGWTGIERKLVRKGHLHKKGKLTPPGLTEESGVAIEMFPTLAAPDAYAHEQAFVSQRATIANMWHANHGLRSRIELGVRELLEI